MANKTLQVICITDAECPRNEEFRALMASAPNGRMIDFYTSDIEDLSLIAKHRILPVPTILVLSNTKVVMRLVRPPNKDALADMIANLPSLFK